MKIRIVFLFFIFLFILIILRLFFLQVLSSYQTSSTPGNLNKITPERGVIYDRNMQPLVLNQTKYKLYAVPKKIKDKNLLLKDLNNLTNIDKATIEARLDGTKDWVSVLTGIEKDTKDKIDKLNYKGLGFEDEYYRSYPEASLSAHLLGFVGKNKEGGNVGYFGVEGYYNKDLSGLYGLIKTEKDLLGRYIFIGNQQKIEPENGRNLVLTIDKSVQEIAKVKLIEGIQTYQAKDGCVIIANPSNMEILALVCIPDYDLERYYDFSEDFFLNNAISMVYEPGSTFKPLIMAAALEEKKIKTSTVYNEKGPIKIGEYTIRTWDNKYEGRISATRILEKSSNVGMVWIGEKLGNKNILKYLKKFGLVSLTGIDLQGETKTFLKSNNQWYSIDYATATFGQGIAVTPIQMITAFSSLINGGELIQPHVVKKIINSTSEKLIEKKVIRKTISVNTSETIKKMLYSTVENGEYKWVKPEGYKIGGKTGTAQIPIGGKYEASKTIASFIGFAPLNNPKFIALVVLREPKTSIYGSETAAPIFFNIAKDLFVYYNIAPE
ncbi:MAG: penicillin-binding protein 2 [bacterium]